MRLRKHNLRKRIMEKTKCIGRSDLFYIKWSGRKRDYFRDIYLNNRNFFDKFIDRKQLKKYNKIKNRSNCIYDKPHKTYNMIYAILTKDQKHQLSTIRKNMKKLDWQVAGLYRTYIRKLKRRCVYKYFIKDITNIIYDYL